MLSNDEYRNKHYAKFLVECANAKMQVQDIIALGHRLMRRAGLHPHFYGDNSLVANAQYLTFFALKYPYEYSNPNYMSAPLNVTAAAEILRLFERRIAQRIPVEYITNEAKYLDYMFYVDEHVLVPRSLMNTRFKEFLAGIHWENYRVLDLCAGSGCIGITLALLNPRIQVDLVDISAPALAIAQENIKRYNLEDRVSCIQSDLFTHVDGKYDLIISNPPYVAPSLYKRAPAEFKREPRIALECGDDGLELVHAILRQARNYLNPHGQLIMEVGYPAAKVIKKRYRDLDLRWYAYKKPQVAENRLSKLLQPLLAMHAVFACEATDL